ncbi:hypothetical protein PGB90_005502 [Kerria lacca]
MSKNWVQNSNLFGRSVGNNSWVSCSLYGYRFKSSFIILFKNVREISRAADCSRAHLPGLDNTAVRNVSTFSGVLIDLRRPALGVKDAQSF